MAYGDFKDLTRRTASHNILRDKALILQKNPKYDWYQRSFPSVVHIFFDKQTSDRGIKNEKMSDQLLGEDFHKSIIRKFKKTKLHSTFIDNILGADLADMQSISKLNKGCTFLLYGIN